jgi:hypothetical protein
MILAESKLRFAVCLHFLEMWGNRRVGLASATIAAW